MAICRSNHSERRKIRESVAVLGAYLLLGGLLSGCAAVVVGGTAATAQAGIEYTITGVAYRTVNADLTATKKAAKKALEQLGMNPSGPVTTNEGAKIVAITANLNIYVELERITSRATKISVDAKAGIVKKDKATAAEILRRTIANLGIKE